MIALHDVARTAEVSKATASRALSGHGYVAAETRDRVISAAAALGYVVPGTSALPRGRTSTLGVVVPHINRWYFGEVLEGIEHALVSSGYDLTLYELSSDASERRRVMENFLVRRRVDAVIAVGIELTVSEVDLLRSLATPVVGIGGHVDGVTTLGIDDVAAAAIATDHLLALGHRDIVHVGADHYTEPDSPVYAQRLRGFRRAMATAGLEGRFRVSPLSIPDGFAHGLTLLADDTQRPTAIVAGSDEIAIGLLLAARQLGLAVPAELSIVGIDGHQLAELFGLTTLEQHPRQYGSSAVALVLATLAGSASETAPTWQPSPAHLVVRSSTSAPAHDSGREVV